MGNMAVQTYNELQDFKKKLEIWLNNTVSEYQSKIENAPICVFFSYGNHNQRAQVWETTGQDIRTVLKRLLNFIDKRFERNRKLDDYLKVDLAYNVEKMSWSKLVTTVTVQKHNNHYRKGISFDEKFNICFLEQEIYGKAIIKGLVYNQPNFFDEKNLNDAIKKKYPTLNTKLSLDKIQDVWTFDTVAAFYENDEFLDLYSTGCENGTRIIQGDKKQHIKSVLLKNAEFLNRQILEDGRFIYGYFAAYCRELKSYNTVRHCTSAYALLESLEVEPNQAYLANIKKTMQYAIQHFYKEVDDRAFMIDGKPDELEIKLGSNAAAIFMFAKYQEITQDNQYQHYAEKLAKGITYMIDQQGETTHVLHYPSLEVKEKFRIVYYDGEAALGLLRLYQLNHDSALLDTVKLMFEHFITKKYDKYHDHWLSYCTNELTKICPEEKYFQFGLNNYLKHMEFIADRKTAYATFLEMMMSAHKMVTRMQEQGFHKLYETAKFDELKQLIEDRVEFQRATGFFYPEVAMYMARPDKVLNGFYVRHDRFRTRIDDQEHNLSGYVAYYNYY